MVFCIDCVLYYLTYGTLETEGLLLDSRVCLLFLSVVSCQEKETVNLVIEHPLRNFAQSVISSGLSAGDFLASLTVFSIYFKAKTFLPLFPFGF